MPGVTSLGLHDPFRCLLPTRCCRPALPAHIEKLALRSCAVAVAIAGFGLLRLFVVSGSPALHLHRTHLIYFAAFDWIFCNFYAQYVWFF